MSAGIGLGDLGARRPRGWWLPRECPPLWDWRRGGAARPGTWGPRNFVLKVAPFPESHFWVHADFAELPVGKSVNPSLARAEGPLRGCPASEPQPGFQH